MAKKQKQKSPKKQAIQNQPKKKEPHDIRQDVSSDRTHVEVRQKPEKISVPSSGKKTHIDPWVIGLFVFGLGIMFTLVLSTAFATGFKQSQNVAGIIVSSLQDTFVGETADVDDGKIDALDGERVAKSDVHHPIAVMFDNHVSARPQSGLQDASIVYETLVEGSITRFMGIFDHETLEKIGPVRSSRPYFTQWVDPLDAGYVHAGGSPEALLKIREYGIKDLYQGQYYWRESSRSAPHNLYTSTELLIRAVRDLEWTASETIARWSFDNDPEKGTHDDGGAVSLHFSGASIGSLVRWEYVPESESYKRFQAGSAHEDAETGEQIKSKTIIVQVIPPIVAYGDHGRLTLDVLGEGTAHILFEGKRIEGTWKQEQTTDRVSFFDENGSEIVFPRGNIFIEVIPSDRELVFE